MQSVQGTPHKKDETAMILQLSSVRDNIMHCENEILFEGANTTAHTLVLSRIPVWPSPVRARATSHIAHTMRTRNIMHL